MEQISNETTCYYHYDLPEIGEMVAGVVTRMNMSQIDLTLPEFEDAPALLLVSQLSHKKYIRSLTKITRVGKTEFVRVVNVNPETRSIDVTKRNVHIDEKEQCKDYFEKSRKLHNMMKRLAVVTDMPLTDVTKQISWAYYSLIKEDHPMDLLKDYRRNPDIVKQLKLETNLEKEFTKLLQKHFAESINTYYSTVDVRCPIEGIDTIKKTLIKAKQMANQFPNLLDSEFLQVLYTGRKYMAKIISDDEETSRKRIQAFHDSIRQDFELELEGEGVNCNFFEIEKDFDIMN